MTFEQLQYGHTFQIDGVPYQVWLKSSRVVLCLRLTTNYDHMRDSTGELLTSAFSDLRVNRNNATPAECATYLETLRAANQTNE